VAISAYHQQIRRTLLGISKHGRSDRKTLGGHLFEIDMSAVPIQLQGDFGAGIFITLITSVRIYD
jgi:hypothetical protein